MSFFERLSHRCFPKYIFTERYRFAAGLEEIFNELSNDNQITNAECTKIEKRPGAQKAIAYIKDNYGLHDGIPHTFFNVSNGTCLRGPAKSRYNLHNVIPTTHEIREMLKEGLWTQEEITVITPYRAQAKQYRKRNLKLYKLTVSTVDAMQGHENKCTIFDIVLSFTRIGPWGPV